MERTSNKSQHTKLTLEKKILPPLLLGFELAAFRSRARRSTNKLSRLPRIYNNIIIVHSGTSHSIALLALHRTAVWLKQCIEKSAVDDWDGNAPPSPPLPGNHQLELWE